MPEITYCVTYIDDNGNKYESPVPGFGGDVTIERFTEFAALFEQKVATVSGEKLTVTGLVKVERTAIYEKL